MEKLAIVQTCVPDYRDALFAEVFRRLCTRLVVIAGEDFFSPGLLVVSGRVWQCRVSNVYFARRRLCWQSGAIRPGLAAGVVVVEYNPRVASSMLLNGLRVLLRRPVVLWGHIDSMRQKQSFAGKLWRTLTLRLSSGFVAYTENQLNELRHRGYCKAAVAIGNSNVRAAGLRRARRERGSSVLYIGRLIAPKRVELLIAGFAAFSVHSRQEWKLEIVGDGPMASELKSQAKRLLPHGNYIFHGHKNSADDLAEVFERAYVSVSAGYVGLAAIHSFSHGVPMLVADKENHAPEIEACLPGFNCEFFTAGSAQALAHALERITRSWPFASPPEIQERALKSYAVERCAERIVRIAEGVLAEPKGAIV